MSRPQLPPAGVTLSCDIEDLGETRSKRWRARVRWVIPDSRPRKQTGRSKTFAEYAEAEAWIAEMQRAAESGLNPDIALSTLTDYGTRVWDLAMRGLEDKTMDPYGAGWKKLVKPAAGHIPIRMVSNGLVDRCVHTWISDDVGRSRIKNALAAWVRIMEQAKRDNLVTTNPVHVKGWQRLYKQTEDELDDPRALALPDWDTLVRLADALVDRSHGRYRGWADITIFAACTAARIGEVSGVRVRDIDPKEWIWTVRRQTTPGTGGLVDKPTKGKRARWVPIMPWLQDLVSSRLRVLDDPDARLFTGPRGGRISTAVFRDATHWDDVVSALGYDWLKRHGLRHTGLTWMADAGVKLHDLQEIAGHGDPGTTKRYLHTNRESVKAAGEALNVHLLGPAAPSGSSPRLKIVRDQTGI